MAQYQQYQHQFPALFKRVLIENKPKVGLKGERCCGADPEEIRTVMGEAFGYYKMGNSVFRSSLRRRH